MGRAEPRRQGSGPAPATQPAEARPASKHKQHQPGPWQQRAQQLRACVADTAAALSEARTRVVPHFSDLFASADEASAALLETDAERAAFIALAEANATPGTGVSLEPAELAERAAVPAQLCKTLGSTCGSLFHMDPAGRISLTVDTPAVAYSLPSSRSGLPLIRHGPLVLGVPHVRRHVRRVTVANMVKGLRTALSQLTELSDEAVWAMAAGVWALTSPKGTWTPPVHSSPGAAVAVQGGVTAAVAARPTCDGSSAAIAEISLPAGGAEQREDGAAHAAPPPPVEADADAAPGTDMVSPNEQPPVACAMAVDLAATSVGKLSSLASFCLSACICPWPGAFPSHELPWQVLLSNCHDGLQQDRLATPVVSCHLCENGFLRKD